MCWMQPVILRRYVSKDAYEERSTELNDLLVACFQQIIFYEKFCVEITNLRASLLRLLSISVLSTSDNREKRCCEYLLAHHYSGRSRQIRPPSCRSPESERWLWWRWMRAGRAGRSPEETSFTSATWWHSNLPRFCTFLKKYHFLQTTNCNVMYLAVLVLVVACERIGKGVRVGGRELQSSLFFCSVLFS